MGAFLPLLLAARDLADPLRTAEVARQVFYWLGMTLMGLVGLVTPGMAAEALAVERRSGSLDFLLATPVRPREILTGKVLGCVSVVSLLLSPSLPLFGLCYLFRGASGPQVLEMYVLLLVTTLVAAYLGVTASAMQASVAAAKWQAYLLALPFLAVPGGAFATLASLASPVAELRKSLAADSGASLLTLTIAVVLLGLLAINATERLRYADHS
jgi:ABC-type Na+ efflux pump permease subunit